MRKAYLLKEYDIPAELYVNSDQTQCLYAAGDKLTYAQTGAKQVSVVGADEKQAFTVMVSVTSAGLMLPFQMIYTGKTEQSCLDPLTMPMPLLLVFDLNTQEQKHIGQIKLP